MRGTSHSFSRFMLIGGSASFSIFFYFFWIVVFFIIVICADIPFLSFIQGLVQS